MRSAELKITTVLKSPGFTWLLILESFIFGWATYLFGIDAANVTSGGMWFPDFDSIVPSKQLSAFLAVLALALCCVLMSIICRAYSAMKLVPPLFVGLFTIMVSGTPELYVSLDTGVILAFVVLVCIGLLYSIYLMPQQTRRIFLIFFLLACGVLFDYSFIPFIIVFMIGLNQMRCFSFRTVLAAFIGLITPLWILWGFGILNFHEFVLPDPSAVYKLFLDKEGLDTFMCVGLTMLIGMVLGLVNITKTFSFNARNRAFTGVWSVMGVVSGLLCILDFTNIWAYVPLLDICAAYQAALFLKLFERIRSYIVIILILLLYIGCFVWNLTV